MEKIDIGQTVSVLANLGVIAGIIFLAVELQQNNEALDAQSRFNHTSRRADFFFEIASDSEFVALIAKAQAGEPLSTEDDLRLYNFYMGLFTNWQWEFGEDRLGRLDAPVEAWRRVMQEIPNDVGWHYPRIRETWESNKFAFTLPFIAFMDELVSGAASQ